MRVEVDSTIIDPANGRVHATITSGGEKVLLSWSARDALVVGDALILAACKAMQPCKVHPIEEKRAARPHGA